MGEGVPRPHRCILIAVGVVLAQPGATGVDQYPSITLVVCLNVHEKNYTVTERETLAMIYVVKKFRHYLLGNKFTLYIDHSAITSLVNKLQLSGRIARWILLLSKFDYKIVYKPRKTHVVPECLSRLESGEVAQGIDDQLPDHHLHNIEELATEGADDTQKVYRVLVKARPELGHYL